MQQIYRSETTLLKSHFGMGVLLLICCIFSEHLFERLLLDIKYEALQKHMARLSYVNKVDNRQWKWITEKRFQLWSKSKTVQF